MSFTNNIGKNVETLSLYFQGGVRRSIIIFGGIVIILLAPLYFLGQAGGVLWSNLDLNPNRILSDRIVNFKDITINDFTIDRSQLVPLINGETALYTTINNRLNPTIGYFPFVYRIQVLDDQGAIIKEEKRTGYLLPGEVNYVVASPENNLGTRLVVTPEPETQSVLFNPFGVNLADRVNIEIRNPTVTDFENGDYLELRAFLKNRDLVEIRELNLLYLIRDDRDRVVGVGEYVIEYLEPGEEREFYLRYPKPKFRTATRLDIRTFVNYLDTSIVRLPEIIEPLVDEEED